MLVAIWGFSFWAMGRLPARVPIHWTFSGEVDGWGSPLLACLLVPAIVTGAYLLILAYDWGRLDFTAARAMSPATTRQVRILVLLPLITLPLVGAVIYAYWLRHRMEQTGTHPSETL